MPNWCNNTLEVSGEDMNLFKEDVKSSDSELSFNKSQINDLHASQDNGPNKPSDAYRKTISNTYKSEIFTELPPSPPKAMKPYDQRLSTDEIERLKNKSPKEAKLGRHLVSQISF